MLLIWNSNFGIYQKIIIYLTLKLNWMSYILSGISTFAFIRFLPISFSQPRQGLSSKYEVPFASQILPSHKLSVSYCWDLFSYQDALWARSLSYVPNLILSQSVTTRPWDSLPSAWPLEGSTVPFAAPGTGPTCSPMWGVVYQAEFLSSRLKVRRQQLCSPPLPWWWCEVGRGHLQWCSIQRNDSEVSLSLHMLTFLMWNPVIL